MLPCHIFIWRAGHRVRLGCPAGPAAFRGLPLLGKRPQNRCGKRWAKLFTGCSLKGLRVFHDLMAKHLVSVLSAKPTQVCSRRWAQCAQLGSCGGDVMVGEPHDSHWVLLLLPLADARNKNSWQNHSAPVELFHLAKKPGLSFHHWTFFFFFHVKIHCVKLVKSLEYVQTAVTVFYFCI